MTLLTRDNCHLCEQARNMLLEHLGPRGIAFTETDVDTDPDLRADYGDLVPVVLVDGVVVGHHVIAPDAVLTAIS